MTSLDLPGFSSINTNQLNLKLKKIDYIFFCKAGTGIGDLSPLPPATQYQVIFNIFLTFFAFFSTLPSTQTIKVIDLIFFNELALKNWAMNMHFNPIPIL